MLTIIQVKVQTCLSKYQPIKSGVPQGSFLDIFLYLLYTANSSTTHKSLIATFADDAAIMSSDRDPTKLAVTMENTSKHFIKNILHLDLFNLFNLVC